MYILTVNHNRKERKNEFSTFFVSIMEKCGCNIAWMFNIVDLGYMFNPITSQRTTAKEAHEKAYFSFVRANYMC